jgi:hypothetical protein
MESTQTMQMPALGEVGEPCAGCGAPLAGDQRYCLNCGQRRTGPRVDYRRYLAPAAEGAPPQAVQAGEPESGQAAANISPAEPSKPERDFAPLAAVGGIAVLGLMLLVGVLIGKGNSSTSPPPPQIVRVGEGAAGAGSANTEAAGPKTASTKSKDGTAGSKEKTGTGAKAVAGGLTGEAARQSNDTVQASKDDLESLNSQSGDSYQDAVKKLPDKIATPGAPPPIDKSKAPGAGSGAVTIE